MTSEKQLQELAVATHVGLLVLHGLATVYHLRHRDRSWKHVGIHAGAATYSAFSVFVHLKKVGE